MFDPPKSPCLCTAETAPPREGRTCGVKARGAAHYRRDEPEQSPQRTWEARPRPESRSGARAWCAGGRNAVGRESGLSRSQREPGRTLARQWGCGLLRFRVVPNENLRRKGRRAYESRRCGCLWTTPSCPQTPWRGERRSTGALLGARSLRQRTFRRDARALPRAAFRFVRRYLYVLGRCNSLNTARRSRAGEESEQRFFSGVGRGVARGSGASRGVCREHPPSFDLSEVSAGGACSIGARRCPSRGSSSSSPSPTWRGGTSST